MKLFRWYKRHFFNRVFLVYILITMLTGVILFVSLSYQMQGIKRKEALTMSDEILNSLDSYISDKVRTETIIQERLVSENERWEQITNQILKSDDNLLVTEDFRNAREFLENISYYADNEIYGGLILDDNGNCILQFGTVSEIVYNEQFLSKIQNMQKTGSSAVCFSALHESGQKSNAFPFIICGRISDPDDFTRKIGTLVLCFSGRNMPHVYQNYLEFLKGNLYVISDSGELLFDSSEQYEDTGISEVELGKGKTVLLNGEKYVGNKVYNTLGRCYVINMIPMHQILDDVRPLQRSILVILFLLLVLTSVLNFISIRHFNRSLQEVMLVIDEVNNGNLTNFPEIHKTEDEFYYLRQELIHMCSRLMEHIDKEYVYQLRQRDMELYMLQTQINPHLLFNTLEFVRMYLYLHGEQNGAQMLQRLAELFRNTLKKDIAVTIREEIRYLQSYLELFKFRLGDRLTYEFNISNEVYKYATIRHIIQPVVENALVHGVEQYSDQQVSNIRISAVKQGDDIEIIVQDNGTGIEENQLKEIQQKLTADDLFENNSIGIYNVNSRLRIVYGEGYGLSIQSTWHVGTEVVLKIRAMKYNELVNHVQSFNR